MMISPRIQVVALVLAAIGASPPARADGKNEVRAVTFDEDGGVTRVHVRGAQTPTFTVYKLDRPARVVVDLPQARLGDALRGHDSAAVLTPSTWAVSTIAAQQLDDNAVRVIVTLARPGRYDVKTEGNELIVMVMPRDAAPKTASPEELEQAKQQARAAEAARAEAEKSSAAAKAQVAQAQGEAERLRQVAADQAARADAAQRALDDARAAQAKSAASSADVERAKATTAKAQAEAARAKSEAAKASEQAQAAQAELDRLRAAQRDATADALKARDELARTQTDMTRLQKQAETAKQDAERARREADAKTAEAEAAKREAAKLSAQSHSDADRAKQDAARVLAQADAAKQDAERARREADAKAAEAAAARRDVDAKQAELDAKQRDITTKQSELATQRTELASQRDELATKQRDIATKQRDIATKQTELASQRTKLETELASQRDELAAEKLELVKRSEQTRAEADAAKADAAREKLAATNARAEAEHAKADAARAKAEADAERAKAEKLMTDAKQQLAAIDDKTAHAQELEDHARATHAAAEAREEAARDAEAKAIKDRELAAAEAKHAQDARDRAAASDRAKLADEARAADERLAAAKRATADAEARRIAAEQAAQAAKRDLDQTKTTLATVEQQRAATEAAATEAARRRSDAEAAASDAVRRRGEAEAAVAEAAKKRTEAERAASAAEAARFAADKQRAVAEASAHAAETAKANAESSLAELTARRAAAEKAAAELDVRSRAEAKAQAEIAAAKARKAGEDELASARAEAAKLAGDRKRAETELAERRKAVALQQTEATRLETAAAQAKDAADREEARRSKLAQQREDEEKQLATVKQQLADARASGLGPRGSGAKAAPVKVADVPKATPAPKFADVPKAQISDVRFRGSDGAAEVDLAVTGSPEVRLGEVTADHVELIVDHAGLGAKLERTLDVTKFGSPVRSVSSFRDRRNPDRVRLVVELGQAATSTIERDGTSVHWKFAGSHVAHTTDVPPPVIGGFGATSTPIAQESISQVAPQPGRRRIYHGATVDLDFKDAPLHDLLRVIADTGHVNLIVPDTIEAKVTVRLKRVPWDQALDEILASHGLWYRREGNIYRIATRKDLDAEDEQEAARRKAAMESEAPKPQIIRLNYASATELKPKLETMLSPHGHIQVEERTNALIVTDVAGNREQITRLALELDTQTPQITIEARIVEANSDYVRQIGVQWGGNALAGASGGNATGLIFPSSIGITGANEDNATKNFGVSLPSDFAVNIPAATGSGEGGALGVSLGSVASNLNINLRLSALEDVGTVRIISAPKITVLNNKQAEIRQGVSIPISVVSAAGTQTQFVQADLKLTVTPYVSLRDCQIAMTLDVSKNEPDFVNVGARGDPTIVRKEAHTTMLVADGETSVLGGIYTRNSGLAYKKVPFFADLPFIGWLFKNRRENDNRTEVLVFITPKITNKASLTCTQ